MIIMVFVGLLINGLFLLAFRTIVHSWNEKDEKNLIIIMIFLFLFIFGNFLWILMFIFGDSYYLESYSYLLGLMFAAPPIVFFCYGVEKLLSHGKGLGDVWSGKATPDERMKAIRGWIWMVVTWGQFTFIVSIFGLQGLLYLGLFLVLTIGKERFLKEKPQQTEPA